MKNPENQQSREKGFILIVAITILMGILAVVTTLVRISKDSTDHQRNFLKTNQALNAVLDTGLGWVEYVFRNRSGDTGTSAPHPYSRLQQNWWGDGMQGIPFTLILAADVVDGQVNIDVDSLRPVFLSLAVNQNTGITIDTTSMYTVYNEELRVGGSSGTKVGGGMAFSTLGTGTDEVFGISTDMQSGYINIGERWLRVDAWEITNTRDRLRIGDLNVRDDDSSMEAYAGESITYYPFDPALDIGENRGGLVVTFEDEAGKFNINGLTKPFLDRLGYNATAQGNYLKGMMYDEFNGLESYLPHRQHHAIAHRMQYDLFNDDFLNTLLFTPYSRALVSRDRAAYSMRGHELDTHEVLSIDVGDASKPISWSSSGSSTQHFVTRTPVNVNSASLNTLKLLFESILGNLSAPNETLAEDLANSIIEYRNNTFFVGRQIPNPFDGMDNTDESNLISYPSPEEEFRAFLLNTEGIYEHDLDDEHINNLMAHVYYEAFDLEFRLDDIEGSNYLSMPIGFEWDDTWTINVTSTSGYEDRPSSTRSHNIVAVPTNRSLTGEIHINSSTGWNRAYSTFHGVTRKQPMVEYDDTNPDEIKIDEGAVRKNPFGHFHIAGGMHGRFDSDAGINIRSFLRYSGDSTRAGGNMIFSVDLNGNAAATLESAIDETNALDFGLRVITEDSEDLGDIFGANVTIAGNYGIGATSLALDAVIGAPEDALWANRWMVFSDNLGTGPQYVEVLSVAGNVMTVSPTTFEIDGDDVFFLLPEYHPDYRDEDENSADHPYYETIVHVPGAHQFNVTWYDSTAAGGTQAVNGYYYNSTTDNWVAITGAINSDNYVRLRFSFDNGTGGGSRPDLMALPQLFGIKVDYDLRRDAPPMYIFNRN